MKRGFKKGQGLVEYALILVLIAIVVIVILSLLGTRVSDVFSQINSGLGLSGIGGGSSGSAITGLSAGVSTSGCFLGTCTLTVTANVSVDTPGNVTVSMSGCGSASGAISGSGSLSFTCSGAEHGSGQVCAQAANSACVNVSW